DAAGDAEHDPFAVEHRGGKGGGWRAKSEGYTRRLLRGGRAGAGGRARLRDRGVVRFDADRTGGDGELEPLLGEQVHDREVDALLHVHVQREVGRQHVVDELELQPVFAEGGQVAAVEARVFLGADDRVHRLDHRVRLRARDAVGQPEAEDDAPVRHPAEVVNEMAEQIRVRDDELFAAQRVDARALDADVAHG